MRASNSGIVAIPLFYLLSARRDLAYAFFTGRGGQSAWMAYGVLLVPPLVQCGLFGTDRVTVSILGLIAALGYVGMRSCGRAPSPGDQVAGRNSGVAHEERTR
jgi:hypothetical protein